jgi:hypothetical protein
MWLVSGGIFASVILFGIFLGGMRDNITPPNPVVAQTSNPTMNAPAQTAVPDMTPQVASPEPPALIRRFTYAYTRPSLAPNGEPWPTVSGYMTGYPFRNADGQSSLTIDNRKKDSDVIVKLYDLGASPPTPVRVMLLLAGDWLKMANIDAGQYDLRYQDLNSGSRFESESFPLTEGHETIQRDDGATVHKSQASDDTITLYTTPEGRFKFREIGLGEF